jgi:hypothetical protein
MKSGIRLAALGVAIAVNAAALGAVHVAMIGGGGHEAAQLPVRVDIIGRMQHLPAPEAAAAITECREKKAL